jgi:hypothetical protein
MLVWGTHTRVDHHRFHDSIFTSLCYDFCDLPGLVRHWKDILRVAL